MFLIFYILSLNGFGEVLPLDHTHVEAMEKKKASNGYWGFGGCTWRKTDSAELICKCAFLPVWRRIVTGNKLLQMNRPALPSPHENGHLIISGSNKRVRVGEHILMMVQVSGVEDGPSRTTGTDTRGRPRQQKLWEAFGHSAGLLSKWPSKGWKEGESSHFTPAT